MFLDKIEKRATDNQIDWTQTFVEGGDISTSKALKESTYFKCIKILSESVAKLPINLMQNSEDGESKVKNHYLYNLLRYRPNEYMSSIDFFKAMEATRQHKGDSFALITRDSRGKVTGLYPINVKRIVIDNMGLVKSKKKNKVLIEYEVSGQTYNCMYSDVLHFKGFTQDGLECESIKDTLDGLIETNIKSLNYQRDLFANGLTNKALVQLTNDIKDDAELKKIQGKFNKMYSAKGRILTVPAGYNVTPLNLSLADSQFEQLKRLNAIDLATAFGVPPYMLGFTEGYNNNSLEQSSLNYLVNTLLILLESIELELNYKLLTEKERAEGLYFEFNQSVMLRVSQESQANILTKYVAGGIYTPNEARLMLQRNKVDDGDDLIVNSGVLKLKDITKNNSENM